MILLFFEYHVKDASYESQVLPLSSRESVQEIGRLLAFEIPFTRILILPFVKAQAVQSCCQTESIQARSRKPQTRGERGADLLDKSGNLLSMAFVALPAVLHPSSQLESGLQGRARMGDLGERTTPPPF